MSIRPLRCLVAASLLVAPLAAHAAYRIDWHVIANGGGESGHETTTVSGTVAQAATATSCSADAVCGESTWQVTSGYWAEVPCDTSADTLFCNGFDL